MESFPQHMVQFEFLFSMIWGEEKFSIGKGAPMTDTA